MSKLEVARHDDFDLGEDFSAAMTTALSEGIGASGVVIPFAGATIPDNTEPAASPVPLGSLEDHAEFHRKAAAEHDRRKGQAQRDGKAAAVAIRAERKALRDTFNAELAALAEREELTRSEISERVMMAECLAEVSRAAVRTIEKRL